MALVSQHTCISAYLLDIFWWNIEATRDAVTLFSIADLLPFCQAVTWHFKVLQVSDRSDINIRCPLEIRACILLS